MKNLKRTIAIVCGGDSSEHDVSLRSAQGLYSFFDKERYDVYIVDIKGQDWHVELHDGTTAKIDRNDFSFMQDGKAVILNTPGGYTKTATLKEESGFESADADVLSTFDFRLYL